MKYDLIKKMSKNESFNSQHMANNSQEMRYHATNRPEEYVIVDNR